MTLASCHLTSMGGTEHTCVHTHILAGVRKKTITLWMSSNAQVIIFFTNQHFS